MDRINYVMAGEYENKDIKCDNNTKAYVDAFPNPIYFDKATVKHIEKVNEHTDTLGVRRAAHHLFGSAVAMAMDSDEVKNIIAKVEWCNGTESLICVRDVLYTNILATSITAIYEPRYLQAVEDYNSEDYQKIMQALAAFNSMQSYKDSAEYITRCKEKLDSPQIVSQKRKHDEVWTANYEARVADIKKTQKCIFTVAICTTIFFLLAMLVVPDIPMPLMVIGLICAGIISIVTRPTMSNKEKSNKTAIKKSPEMIAAKTISMCDDTFLYIQNSRDNTFSVKAKNSAISGNVIISEVFLGKAVATICANGFTCCRNIKSISVPKSIKKIGANALENCSSLTKIIYDGTKSDWNAISKDLSWDAKTPKYVIHCIDGDIFK